MLLKRLKENFKFSLVTVSLAVLFGSAFSGSVMAQTDNAGNGTDIESAKEIQSAFSEVAEQASDAVVVITNKQVHRQSRRGLQELPPEFRRFFGIPEMPEEKRREERRQVPRAAGRGSGVIISDDGYVVTNYHVIKDHDALEVELHDGTVFDSSRNEKAVEVAGVDKATDLAVLKLNSDKKDKFPTLKFADSEKVQVGEWALALGAPFNFDYSLTVGVVSQKGRSGVGVSRYENFIQTDASINPGNSGGPLLNLDGDIIGINNFIVSGGGMSRGSAGVGFAIASNLAKQVVDDIIKTGSVVRPWLGIAMQELTKDLQEQFDVSEGVLVSNVMEGDPAAEAGIKAGDVIVKVGDETVTTPHELQFAVLKYEPGDKIKIVAYRNGKKKTFKVTAVEKGGNGGIAGVKDEREMLAELGLQLQTTEQGVVIARVARGSVADASQLRRGDIVRKVNRQPVNDVQDVLAALQDTKGDTVLFYIERNGNNLYVPLRIE